MKTPFFLEITIAEIRDRFKVKTFFLEITMILFF